MPYCKVNDVNIYYEELGTGIPILFLHSHFSRGILAFSGQILPFQAQYRCLFPDFRGHGRTICDSLEWDSRQIADDMAYFLDALEIQNAHLFGYSCGAGVGMYMAAKYPNKVRSLVTVGGGTEPRPDGSENYLPENVVKQNNQALIQQTLSRHKEACHGNWKAFLEQTVKDWRNHPKLSDEEWARINCPAFFINGENDPFGSCEELRQKYPSAKVCEMKGCGHRPLFVTKQAKEVNDMVLNFLDETDKQYDCLK